MRTLKSYILNPKSLAVIVALVFSALIMIYAKDADAVATSTWDGGAGTSNWEDALNWSNDETPTSTSVAYIDTAVTVDINAATTTYAIKVGSQSGGVAAVLNFKYDAVTAGAVTTTDDVIIYSSATVTHTAGTTVVVGRIYFYVQGNLNVASGGTINVDQKGYPSSEGPGQGQDHSGAGQAAGASHAGKGGVSVSGKLPGPIYGSLIQPTDLGSGGGFTCTSTNGGEGGGAIKFNVTGTLTVTGSISADGENVADCWAPGGGAGGSVYLTVGTLAGSGTIGVTGGNTTGSGASAGGGGGGRIAVYYTTDSSSITYSFNGGDGSYAEGGSGTLYKKSSTQTFGDLTLNNNALGGTSETALGATPLGYVAGEQLEFDSITATSSVLFYYSSSTAALITASTTNLFIKGNSIFDLYATTTLTYGNINWDTGRVRDSGGTFTLVNDNADITIPSASTLISNIATSSSNVIHTFNNVIINGTLTNTVNSNDSTDVLYKINWQVNGNLTINSAGTINLDYKGFISSLGPGQGGDKASTGYAGGASHAGLGGVSSNSIQPGQVYGSLTTPTDLGSGGGYVCSSNEGGDGGGALKLNVTGTLTVTGTITADGETASACWGPGGGSGGSIYLTVGILAGTGSIGATGGGASGSGAGGGGGGRIAVYYTTDSSTITYAVNGGDGWSEGGSGTLYKKSSTQTFGDLTLDNNSLGGTTEANFGLTPLDNGSTFDNFTLQNSAKINATSTNSIIIHGNLTIGTSSATTTQTVKLQLTGTGNQSITHTGTVEFPGQLEINKSSGITSLTRHYSATSTCTLIEGILSLDGYGMECNKGFAIQDGSILRVYGSEMSTTTTPTIQASSTIEIIGDQDGFPSTFTFPNWSFYHLRLAPESNDIFDASSTSDFTVGGNLQLLKGSFVAPSTTMYLAGDFITTNESWFVHSSGTVGFINTATSTIQGNINFYSFTATTTGQDFAFGSGNNGGLFYNRFQYRKSITIDADQVTADQTNFPILVSLTDVDLAARAQSTGYDIAFFDDKGLQLAYDRETFNSSTGELNTWVNLPAISSTTDKLIYMAYGDSDSADQQSATSTWDNYYAGVWHLGETSGTNIDDSTSNNINGTKSSEAVPTATSTGQIDGAQEFTASDNIISIPDNSAFDLGNVMTIEAWIRPDSLSGRQTILGRSNQSSVVQLEINNSSGAVGTIINGIFVSYTGSSVLTQDVWNHVVYTRDGSGATHQIYVNGQKRTLVTNATNGYANPTGAFELGRRASGSQRFDGSLDEFRISNIARTPQWIQTEYNNQSATSTFYQVGTEESYTSTVGDSIGFYGTMTVTGADGNRTNIYSTSTGQQWVAHLAGTSDITYANIADSGCSGTTGTFDVSDSTSSNSGNNGVCWNFGAGGGTLSSDANQTFQVGQATTTISTITITAQGASGITSTNDIRIVIPAATNMIWNTDDTLAVLGGTALANASTTVSYSDNKTLVIDVETTFEDTDTLTVSGLSFAQFSAISTVDNLELYLDGAGDMSADDTDDKDIIISGIFAMATHTVGLLTNQLAGSATDYTDTTFYAFQIQTGQENETVTQVVFTLENISAMVQSDFANFKLYVDYDSDLALDAGETQVGGAGIVSVTLADGIITFSSSFTVTTTRDYILIGDIVNIGNTGEGLDFILYTTGITSTGDTSGGAITHTPNGDRLAHYRISNLRAGDSTPGRSNNQQPVTGGGPGGGGQSDGGGGGGGDPQGGGSAGGGGRS